MDSTSTTPHRNPDSGVAAFNSIEWIHLDAAPETITVGIPPFNSIEWIQVKLKLRALKQALAFNSIEWIHGFLPGCRGKAHYGVFQFHWMDSEGHESTKEGATME